MGCSNPHPHGQTWSLSYIPTIPAKILESLKGFALDPEMAESSYLGPKLASGRPGLLLTYVTTEINQDSPRIIFKSLHFVALVPYWATWPYEVLILPYHRHISHILQLSKEEKVDLADTIRRVTCRMDNIFQTSFAYSMGIYQSPTMDDKEWGEYAQFHLGFYPPLLRSASVRKFLVGFELFAEAQRDITPEQAATKYRECSEVHYKHSIANDI